MTRNEAIQKLVEWDRKGRTAAGRVQLPEPGVHIVRTGRHLADSAGPADRHDDRTKGWVQDALWR